MADRSSASDKPKGAGNPNRINRMLVEQAQKKYTLGANLIVLTNKGLNSEQTAEVRGEMRAKKIKLNIVRNRLTLKVFREMGVAEAEKLFVGPTAIIESEDPVSAAKLALEFCKKFEGKLFVSGGLVEGKVLDAKQVTLLSKSKSKPELLSEIASLIRGPGAQLAAQILGPGRQLASQVKGHTEKLEKAG